jgi:hypothetical protein
MRGVWVRGRATRTKGLACKFISISLIVYSEHANHILGYGLRGVSGLEVVRRPRTQVAHVDVPTPQNS